MGKIELADCIEAMKSLRNESVDLIVTSPPYGIGKEYETKITIEEYKDFAKKWLADIPRILKETGSFWLNIGYIKTGPNSTLPLTYLYHELIELPLVQEIVWHYEGGMSYKKRFTHRTERWMWFAKNPEKVLFNLDEVRVPTKNFDKRNNPLGKNPTDYWYFDRVANVSKEKTSHPCQFPEKMIARVIKACSNSGDLVLDPFGGSMTTAVVAEQLGRDYLCYELDEEYLLQGKQRLAGVKSIC